jgi:hypothetical protein
MALNLWKLGGKPTSYNPLLTTSQEVLLGIGQYNVKIKASSATNQKVMLQLGDGVPFLKAETLSPVTKEYFYELNSSKSQMFSIRSFASNTIHDIIIEDIQLVEKPLGKATINGIDGFLSGKWSINSNARVIDDETLELIGTIPVGVRSNIIVPVISGQTYSFHFDGDFPDNLRAYMSIADIGETIQYAFANANTKVGQVTIPNGVTSVKIRLHNEGITGKFTFRKPMFNLGTIPAPYEPKRGERIVMPVMKGKNLFNKNAPITSGNLVRADNGLLTTANGYSATDFILIKPSTPYIMSGTTLVTTPSQKGAYYDSAKNFIRAIDVFSTTSPVNAYFMRLTIPNTDFNTYQIEEGIQPTPYEPYESYTVQVNAKPKVKVPKKNLWGGAFDLGFVLVSTNDIFTPTQGQRTTKWILCKPNTTYLISGGDRNVWQFADSSMNRIVGVDSIIATTPSNAMYMRVYYSTNGLHTQVQIEQGTQVTPYEPYKEVLPPAKKGLVMDGVRNYIELQVAPPTNYAIEFEFILNTLRRETHLVSFRNNQLYVIANGSMYVRNAQISTALTNIKPNVWYKMRVESQNGSTKTYINNVLALTSPFDWGGISPLVVGDFWSHIGDYKFDGTFKYVKLEDLNNTQTVAHYDFTNPNNIIGDKVLQSAKNLIPSFDSQQWSLHPNFKVLGKDVGRLDATSAGQLSEVLLNVKPNTTYFMNCQVGLHADHRYRVRRDNSSGANLATITASGQNSFTTPNDVNVISVTLYNNLAIGSFDFIRPQLYELTGKEGTLYGNPVSELKAPKRLLFAKR